jgi:signal transduction histidine kinase
VKSDIQDLGPVRLPWWTWVVPFIALHLGSQVAIMTRYDQGVADYYLPTAISIVLVNIWGPWRTIPAVYINATLSTYLWDVENVFLWPVFAFPETLMVILSWYWFSYRLKGKFWLPNIRNLLLFLVFGISLPILVEIGLLETLQVFFGEHSPSQVLSYFTRNILSEFIANFGLTLPALAFLTPILQRRHLLYSRLPENVPMLRPARRQVVEVCIVFAIMTALTFLIPFDKFWFIYGIFALYIALRQGFAGAAITNLYILLITYIIPTLAAGGAPASMDVIYIFLGTTLLFVFAAITGRVISDLRITEQKLSLQNAQLELANKELDRFVYSVSHDLSAPLKSILGLVAINRLATSTSEANEAVDKIETSVVRLESLIREILDFSYNKRQELKMERIRLKSLCTEILESLTYMEGYESVRIHMDTDGVEEIYNDKARLKLILSNLLANAILFQKKTPGHEPYVRITALREKEFVLISIEDNGEGIKPSLQHKIFNMFYRGTITSKGSGLGLYIAREAAERISSRIFVESEYGRGSVFTLAVPEADSGQWGDR